MSATPAQRSRRVSFRLTLPCSYAGVREGARAAREFLLEQAVAAEDLTACELSLAEGGNNAVQYAGAGGRPYPVAVEVLCGAEEIEMRVEDHTPGFDWPARVALPEETAEHGRGLYLIRSLMDEVTYLRGGDTNCLVLRRRRRVPAPGVAAGAVDPGELARRFAEDERIIRDMAEELGSCYESLSAIFRYGAEQGRVLGIDDFARRLLGDLLRVTGADWYLFRMFDSESSTLKVFASPASSTDLPPLPVPEEAPEDAPAEVRAAVARRDCWIDSEHRASDSDPLLRVQSGSCCMIHPVALGETLVGTLAVGRSGTDRRLTAAAMSIVQTLGDFLAIQIMNARFQEERLRNLLVARELEIARHVQRSLLPASISQPRGMELVGYCESAREVGGDLYDVIPLANDGVLMVVSDVMGKGLPAAMFALMLRSLVRASRALGDQPGRLLHQVNDLLQEELSRVDMFITAQLVFVDPRRRRLAVANAGHCPFLFCSAPGAAVEIISPDGMPIGVLPDVEFHEVSVPFGLGACCLIYTDGLTEARNPAGEMFGQERLRDWLSRSAGGEGEAEAMKRGLVRCLQDFQQDQALRDDQTFLILRG